MIKVIHVIMLGDRMEFSNLERNCVNTWKKIYPDWEIKIWRDKDCIDWINNSKFASSYYYNPAVAGMAYVSDYVRCMILYEFGGLYMDFDVFAVNRIPDSYFEKAFTAWDVLGKSINNGTCMYAPEPHLKIFKEFAEAIDEGETKVGVTNGSEAANIRIEKALYKYGFENKFQGEDNLDLGEIIIYNRSQFGARHEEEGGYLTHGKEVYLVHACSGSWVKHSFSGYVEMLYTVIDRNTDMNELKRRLRLLIKNKNLRNIFVFFMADVIEYDSELKELIGSLGYGTRTFVIPHENTRGSVFDYTVRRIKDIHITRDFMR